MEERTYITPLDDLRKSDLEHYEEASLKIHCHHSGIPNAINFYYDFKQMDIWKKLKLIFKL